MQTLESIIQLQLATETTSVFHLPTVLESLTEEHFQSPPQSSAGRTKWIARVNSLLHSKEPAGRWAGACLARRTAAVSREILLECASGWIAVALPWFSVCTPFGSTKKHIDVPPMLPWPMAARCCTGRNKTNWAKSYVRVWRSLSRCLKPPRAMQSLDGRSLRPMYLGLPLCSFHLRRSVWTKRSRCGQSPFPTPTPPQWWCIIINGTDRRCRICPSRPSRI